MNKLSQLKCLRCGYSWVPRTEEPKRCPRCLSPYWSKKKKAEIN